MKDPRKTKFPLKSVQSAEFNDVVQIDHQKICKTDSGYYQILVIIDHFTKLAEAVPCQMASGKKRSLDNALDITIWLFDDIPIGHWEGICGGPDNIAQAHSTTYEPQTNRFDETKIRTLVDMLEVYD